MRSFFTCYGVVLGEMCDSTECLGSSTLAVGFSGWLLTPHPALLFSCFLVVVVVFGVCSCSAGSKIFGTEFYVFRPPPRSTNESHQYHSVLCVFPCGVGANESQRLLSLSQSQVEIIYFSAKIQRGTKENYLDSTCDFFTLTVAY